MKSVDLCEVLFISLRVSPFCHHLYFIIIIFLKITFGFLSHFYATRVVYAASAKVCNSLALLFALNFWMSFDFT